MSVGALDLLAGYFSFQCTVALSDMLCGIDAGYIDIL